MIKFYEFPIETTKKEEAVIITNKIENIVNKATKEGIKEGICNIFLKHTTAAITINENADPNILEDIFTGLKRIVPNENEKNLKYKHNQIDDNATAHIKSSLFGYNISIPFKNGKLHLGKWQGIILLEFDGPRKRDVIVGILY